MPATLKPSRTDDDIALLRRAFDVARRAQLRGNHPFGAILVDANGAVLIEMENGFMPDRDMTGHAERLLATQACKAYDPQTLARATMYCSAEPCAMCAGAIYWPVSAASCSGYPSGD
jgi:tRNA(Arg) A34 adenosine deaminase TadA